MPIVTVPGQGDISFPDTMSDKDIAGAIQKNFPDLGKQPAAPTNSGPAASNAELEEMRRTDPEGAANLEAQGYQQKPNAPPASYKPEEVHIAPDLPIASKLSALAHTGIDIDLAKQSSNYDPKAIDQQYKDKNPGLVNNAATSIGSSVPVVGETVGNVERGVGHFMGDVGTAVANTVRSPADQEYAKLQDAINRNIQEQLINKGKNIDAQGNYSSPTGEKVGYGASALGAGIAGGEVTAAALPEVTATGLPGVGLRTARAAGIGAGAGAASEPTDPTHGAEVGAVTAGVLHPIGEAVGATGKAIINKVNKNKAGAAEVAETGDTLGSMRNATTPTSVAFGNPNMTGAETIGKIPYVGSFLKDVFGASKSQGLNWSKGSSAADVALDQMGTDANVLRKAGQPTTGSWQDVLKNEDAIKANPSAAYDPKQFATIYPKLSDQGKQAAITGMFKASLAKNGVVDADGNLAGYNLAGVSSDLKNILETTKNQTFAKGEQKWTLQGLQKYLEASQPKGMNLSPANVSKMSAQDDASLWHPVMTAVKTGVIGLADEVASGLGFHIPGVIALAKAQAAYRLANMAINNRAVRNGLINLSVAKTPGQISTAMQSVNAAAMANSTD